MKKIFLISTLVSTTLLLFAADLKKDESLDLELTPQYKYDENMKYEEEVKEYEEPQKDKKSKIDIDVDVDVNKEERTIDRLKLDMGTKF